MSLAVAVLVRRALHPQRAQRLARRKLLEDQSRAVTLPAHHGVRLVQVPAIVEAGADGRHVRVKVSELGGGLVCDTQRIGGAREGLAPIVPRVCGVEHRGDLLQGIQRVGVVTLDRRSIDEDQVGVGGADSLKVGGADRSENRNTVGAVGQVGGDTGLPSTGHGTDRSNPQRQGVVRRRLRERNDASGLEGKGNLLTGGVGHHPGLGRGRAHGSGG